MDDVKHTAFAQIRMGEMQVDRDGNSLRMLLGSCVGLALYDRCQKIGGFAHIVLPHSRGKSEHLGKFADTAIPTLIRSMQELTNQALTTDGKARRRRQHVHDAIGRQYRPAERRIMRADSS